MFDALKEIANARLKRKKAKDEAEKAARANRPNMMDSKNYEESLGFYELLKKKREDEEEDV